MAIGDVGGDESALQLAGCGTRPFKRWRNMKDAAYYEELAAREAESGNTTIEESKYESKFFQRTLLVPFRKLHSAVKRFSTYMDLRLANNYRDKIADAMPIQDNKFFIMTFQKTLTCNPRYVVDELLRRGDNIEIVVCGDGSLPPEYQGIPNIRTVKRLSMAHFVEQASAKVWIDNAMNCQWWPIKKKPGQLYLQTWHGSLGLKRIGPQYQSKRWLYAAKRVTATTDYLFSNSDFETNVYRENYWPNGKILLTGHARNDIFFHADKMTAAREKVLSHYQGQLIPHQLKHPDIHIALYGPTFRDVPTEEHVSAHLNFNRLKAALEERFGGTWLFAIRMHPRDKKNAGALLAKYPFCFNVGDYPEIEELMCACDMAITDYSSWICDYSFTRKPAFLYTPDIDHYVDADRGFYYPLESTPFAVCRTSEELAESICKFDDERYQQELEDYWKRLGCMENGTASSTIADIVEAYMAGTSIEEIDAKYQCIRA